jgi:predicted metal-dependent phosphotriesterase family hydrolase
MDDVLELLKVKINNMNKKILNLQEENKILKSRLANIDHVNYDILQKSEDIVSNIDKTLSQSHVNNVDLSDIIRSTYE